MNRMTESIGRLLLRPAGKPIALLLGLLPAAWLVYAATTDALGANPAEALIRSTGDWALRLLCITLAVTPLRVLAGLPQLARYRRMAGLLTYFYACLHLLAYAWLDMGLDLAELLRDVAKRPFILVGMVSWLLLTALAATSFNAAVRRLGGAAWRRLHRLVYGIAPLVVLHFFWMRAGKRDWAEVAVYGAILAALLAWRAWHALRPRPAI